MKPNPRFLGQPKHFWANVRSISQKLGYTKRGEGKIKIPTLPEMRDALHSLGLKSTHLADSGGKVTALGKTIHSYFKFRENILNETVEPHLMTLEQAAKLFASHKRRLRPTCPIPMNKQKGEKKTEAYFTGLINMLIEANTKGYLYWPQETGPRL